MSNGPILIYDKSAMQRLSADEAEWLTHFFRCNITPVYLLEVMGDLAKNPKRGTPESMVAALAAKTSSMGSLPNVLHTELIDQEILGNPVEMRGVPIVGGAQSITTASGEKGVFFDESPEEKTLRRWQNGGFEDEERAHASVYRQSAKSIDLQAFIRASKSARPKGQTLASSLSELLKVVDIFLNDPGAQYRTLTTALEMFDQPPSSKRHVKKHWAAYGRPPIRQFLPYTYHCMRVFTLFGHGVGLGLIPQRPTNVIDLQYLFYLPFCMVFTSADKLHHDMVPLFITEKQRYVKSDDMQAALRVLVAYYSAHKAELRTKGMMGFARYPPLTIDTAIHRLYDDLMPRWRKDALVPEKKITPQENERIMRELRPFMEAIENRTFKPR
jgi:hypothetical protein